MSQFPKTRSCGWLQKCVSCLKPKFTFRKGDKAVLKNRKRKTVWVWAENSQPLSLHGAGHPGHYKLQINLVCDHYAFLADVQTFYDYWHYNIIKITSHNEVPWIFVFLSIVLWRLSSVHICLYIILAEIWHYFIVILHLVFQILLFITQITKNTFDQGVARANTWQYALFNCESLNRWYRSMSRWTRTFRFW